MTYKNHDDDDKPKFEAGHVVNSYVVEKEIGCGAFAVVYKVKRDDKFLALKCYSFSEDNDDCLKKELENISLIGTHKNISTDFIENFSYDYEKKTCKAIVLPLANNDLFHFMLERGPMPPNIAHVALIQLASALNHLHGKNLAHGDLKPENILVFLTKNEWCLKLTDFDGVFNYNQEVNPENCRVTDEYAPPEWILEARYELQSDIWSLGCLYFEICTCISLFELDADDSSVDVSDSDSQVSHTSFIDNPDQLSSEDNPKTQTQKNSEEARSSSSSSEYDSEESITEKEVDHLIAMVELLGPFPRALAKNHFDIFTTRGYMRNVRIKAVKLEDMLGGVSNKKNAYKIASIIRPMLSYHYKRRPSAEDILQHRSFLSYFDDDECRCDITSNGMSANRNSSIKSDRRPRGGGAKKSKAQKSRDLEEKRMADEAEYEKQLQSRTL